MDTFLYVNYDILTAIFTKSEHLLFPEFLIDWVPSKCFDRLMFSLVSLFQKTFPIFQSLFFFSFPSNFLFYPCFQTFSFTLKLSLPSLSLLFLVSLLSSFTLPQLHPPHFKTLNILLTHSQLTLVCWGWNSSLSHSQMIFVHGRSRVVGPNQFRLSSSLLQGKIYHCRSHYSSLSLYKSLFLIHICSLSFTIGRFSLLPSIFSVIPVPFLSLFYPSLNLGWSWLVLRYFKVAHFVFFIASR